MKNWTRRNIFKDISLKQFKSMVDEFTTRAEHRFRQETKCYIRLMDGHFKVGDTPAETRRALEYNNSNTFLSTNNAGSITQEQWDKAVSVDVAVTPVDGRKKDISHFYVDGKTARFHLR